MRKQNLLSSTIGEVDVASGTSSSELTFSVIATIAPLGLYIGLFTPLP